MPPFTGRNKHSWLAWILSSIVGPWLPSLSLLLKATDDAVLGFVLLMVIMMLMTSSHLALVIAAERDYGMLRTFALFVLCISASVIGGGISFKLATSILGEVF